MAGSETTASPSLINCMVLTVFILIISTLGLSDFSTRGEAREAIVVQSMLSSGNWILPKAYNEAVPSKPPLFHWMSAIASLPIQKVNEFSARLPSATFAVATLALFLFLLRPYYTPREMLLYTLLLTCSFEWLRASMAARVDMVHASCLSCGLIMSFFALERSKLRYWIAASILFALAALGKGPVAIAIPALILSLWIWRSADRPLMRLVALGICLVVAFLLTSSWYVAAYYQAPHEFMEKFWYENVSRFTGTMEDAPHKHSAAYLLVMLFVGTLPWSPLAFWTNRKKILQLNNTYKSLWMNSSSIVQFSIFSVALIFLFYCIPSSKRSVYLLAAYPFIAILLTQSLSEYISTKLFRWLLCLSIVCIALIQGIILPFVVAPHSSERGLAKLVESARSPESRVYSFGFEFYGAAFYSKQLFLRLEDSFLERKKPPHLNDLVVCFKRDIPAMSKVLTLHERTPSLISETTLNKETVGIFTITAVSEKIPAVAPAH